MSRAEYNVLRLFHSVIGFDIVELWARDAGIGVKCLFEFISDSCPVRSDAMPDLNMAWKDYVLELCDQSDSNVNGFIWHTHTEQHILSGNTCPLFRGFRIFTSMSHRMQLICDEQLYVVCHSIVGEVEYNSRAADFIVNICHAFCLAANTLHNLETKTDAGCRELFFVDMSPQDVSLPSLKELSLSSREVGDNNRAASTSDGCFLASADSGSYVHDSLLETRARSRGCRISCSNDTTGSKFIVPPNSKKPSGSTHIFPIEELPVSNDASDDFSFQELSELCHIAFGRNSAVYSAVYRGEKVAVKVMMPGLESSMIAQQEFDNEQAILRRTVHPNIVKIIGTGVTTFTSGRQQRFTVLEWLSSGLGDMLSSSTYRHILFRKLRRKKAIPFFYMLSIAKDLASALRYLHSGLSFGVTLIHREIEPDNIRFTATGVPKLIGFGRCLCLNSASLVAGNGCPVLEYYGTMSYMAPEIALRLSQSEKSDVYAYGMLIWHIARNKIPFGGMTKSEFMNRVVYHNERPKVEKIYPPELASLLCNCWLYDMYQRPSFQDIEDELNRIISGLSNSSSATHKSFRKLSVEQCASIEAPSMRSNRKFVSERKSAWF